MSKSGDFVFPNNYEKHEDQQVKTSLVLDDLDVDLTDPEHQLHVHATIMYKGRTLVNSQTEVPPFEEQRAVIKLIICDHYTLFILKNRNHYLCYESAISF
ncbi:hypothetical protein SAMN05444392_105120 [Seinonella peptonophila]|uniref:Uncharacterized protein n=1 Tax=Seinonella peptonophila TaxID=112248 RepID=A0A1M4XQA6_9BACL|nr:hypothetical protein [Seinonella peptonophila]SHE95635.1 hypothetical protein SAMN05444392_105120 [Seinonella peptonophila]